MPLAINQEAPPKKRIREKPTVGIGSGSYYIDLYNRQGRNDALSGAAMSPSDDIYYGTVHRHLVLKSSVSMGDSILSGYESVDVSLAETTDTYVKEISHYEAWS